MFHQPFGFKYCQGVAFHQVTRIVEARNGADRADRSTARGQIAQLAAVEQGTAQHDGLVAPVYIGRRDVAYYSGQYCIGNTHQNETARVELRVISYGMAGTETICDPAGEPERGRLHRPQPAGKPPELRYGGAAKFTRPDQRYRLGFLHTCSESSKP